MKSFKIVFAVIAVVFASTSAFKAPLNRLAPPPGYSLYSFVGSNPANQNSWSRVQMLPDCPAASGSACSLQAQPDPSHPLKPKPSDLSAVGSASGGFGVPQSLSSGNLQYKVKAN